MKRFFAVAFVAALRSTVLMTPASAGIINGDFATGTFTGWSTLVASSALGASHKVTPFAGGNRAVLTAAPTSTSPATSAIQQSFSISAAQRLALDFGSDQSLAGLASMQAGFSNVSIVVSQLGGSWSHDWTYNLYNDPAHSLDSLSIPFAAVSTVLPQTGTYLLYAQVQAADGATGNDAFAQLTLGNVRLLAVPEPGTAALLISGIGLATLSWAWRRRVRRSGSI